MTFTFGSNVITQTGTDTDLTGLFGLTDVTVEVIGIKTFYIIASTTRIEFNGTASWDSEVECLVVESNVTSCFEIDGGDVTIGRVVGTNPDSSNRYSKGVGLILAGINNSQFADLAQIKNSGNLTCNGSEIHYGLVLGMLSSGGTMTFNETVLVNDNTTTLLQAARNEGSNVQAIYNNVTLDGTSQATAFFQQNGVATFSGTFRNAFVQPRSGPYNGAMTLQNIAFAKNVNSDGDFQIFAVQSNNDRVQPTEFTNVDIGSAVRFFENNPATNRGHLAIFQNVTFATNDTSGNAINDVKIYLPTTDNGNRVNLIDLAMQNGLDAESTDYDLYEAITSSGETAVIKVLTGRIYCDRQNSIAPTQTLYSKTNSAGIDDYTAALISYGHNLVLADLILKDNADITANVVMIDDSLITQSNKATVDAYSTIDDAFEFYDRAKSYLYDNFAGETAVLMSRQGPIATLGADNVTLDATASSAFTYTSGSPNSFTLHTDIFTGGITTTGTITLQNGTILNGGTFNGDISTADNNITHTNITASKFIHTTSSTATVTFDSCTVTEIEVTGGGTLTVNLTNGSSIPTTTETNGTIHVVQNVTVRDANIIDGSRVQLYNETTSTELDNSVVSGGSGYSFDVNLQSATVSNGDTLRLRVTFQSGTTAKNPLEVSGVVTTNGLSFINTQTDNAVYNSNGVDGASLTEFSWDSGNIQIDINDADNRTSVQNIAAWYHYYITTATGIDEAFGAISWPDILNVEIDTSLVNVTIDNTKSAPLTITGGRIYRTDATTIIAPTSNSILIDVELNNRALTSEQAILLDTAANAAMPIESGLTMAESIRLMNSALLGKVSGAGSGTEIFRDVNDSKDRIISTVDSNGNRTNVVIDET